MALGKLVLCGAAAGLPMGAIGAGAAPTVQSLLAEHDEGMVNHIMMWSRTMFFDVPADMALDPALRQNVSQLASEHLARLRKLLPGWIAEQRAAAKDPMLRGDDLIRALYQREINEMAIAMVESTGPAHDDAALAAALAPQACRIVFPLFFQRQVWWIQAAPEAVRPALLAALKESLSRLGTTRVNLAPRPLTYEMVAAEHAVTRVRQGLPVTAVPMSPWLAGRVFRQDRKPGRPDRWEQCARAQWWLQSQLAEGRVDRAQALTLFRYATLPEVEDLVPEGYQSDAPLRPKGSDKPPYPRGAAYFQVEGTTRMLVEKDEQGHPIKVDMMERKLRVPGVRNNRPLAFEAALDDASLGYGRQRTYAEGKALTEFTMTWTLHVSADGHE